MEGNSNTLSKKTIIAIIIAIILLFVASLSVGIFLANKGDTEAAGGNQISDGNQISVGNRIEDNNQNTNTENNNSETPSDNINNSTVADNSNETTNNNNTVNDTSDNVENNTTNRTNNSTSGVTTKRDTSQVGETTLTRVEEKERVVSRDYWDWWTPTSVAVVSTATKLVPTLPEIVVEKVATTEAGKNVVYAGQKITYTITVKNTGNKDVEKIEVTDKIPENTTFSSIENDGKVIKKENGEKILGVKWIVDVKAGEQVSVKFTVTVNEKMLVETENGEIAEIPTTGTIRNVAVANGEESNEEDTAIITSKKASEIIRDGQKVEIAKLGDEIKYTITVTNTGERDGNTTISDVVPIGTRLKHDSADGAKISENNDIVTWEDVKIPAGESISKTFIVIVNDLDALKENKVRNVATVGGKETNETEDPVAIDILVTKEWNDADNQDGIRPDKITVKLLANDVVVDTVEISKDENGNWSHVFENLPKFLDEQEIAYTIKEEPVPSEYEVAITGTAATGFLVTNTHTPAKINIPVEKTWNDAENQDGIRPGSVIIKLLADGKDTGKILTLNEDNEWKGTFTELDKNKAGKEIAYTIKEEPVPSGYEVAITGTAATGIVVTNTHIPAKIEIPVEKTWDDAENQDGIRPDSVTIKLLADGKDTGKILTLNEDNEWKGTFTELDKNKAGTEIVYTVQEDEVKYYTPEISGDIEKGFLVTNTHTPAKIEIPVEKTWDDAENQDGIRPDSVIIKLLADGEDTGKILTLNEDNEWKGTFTELDKNKAGTETVYTVQEDEVKYYTPEISGDIEKGFLVTNTHTPAKIEIPVEKKWDDAENQDGIRPDSVIIKLLADGEDTGKILTLNEDNEWKGTLTELDKNKAGTETVYTVQEDEVKYYTPEISGDIEKGFLVTNTHTPAKVTIQGTKTWDDSNNSKGKRPSSITIKLLADGVKTGEEVTITEEDSWQYKFENMPKYKSGESGKEIKYTVEEEYVTDYEPTYDDHVEANGNITINIKNTFSQDISGKIISIKETPVPLDVVFVLDISSSMLQTDNDNTTRVQDMVEATNVAISKLMENKNNRVSVVLYNSYVYDLSGNLNYYSRKNNDYITYKHIGGTEIGGKVKFCTGKTIEVSTAAREGGKYCGTYTQGGIKRATQIFKASADNSIVRKPVMILLTDGDPTHYDTKTTYNKYGDRYPGTNRLNGIGIVRFITSEYYAYTMKTMENCKKSITGFYKDSNRKENRECEVYTVGINMKGSMANVLIKPNETNINSLRNTTNISPDVYNGNKDANGNSVWVVGLSNLCNGERLMNEKYYKYQANGLLELLKQNDKTKISGNYANEAYTELTSSKISEKFMEIVNIIEEKTTIDITADLYGSDRKIKLNEFNPNNEYTISITKNGVAIANPEQYIIKDPKDGYYYLTLTNLKGKLHVEMTYYK